MVVLLIALLTTGLVPDFGNDRPLFSIDMLQPEYLAQALTALVLAGSSSEAGSAQIYHVGNPNAIAIARLPDMGEFKSKLALAPVNDWAQAMEKHQDGDDEAGEVLHSLFRRYLIENGYVMFSLEQQKTQAALERAAPGLVDSGATIGWKFLNGLVFK